MAQRDTETKIGFWNDEQDAFNFKLNAVKNRVTVRKILSKFIEKFNENPTMWLEQLGFKK